MGHNTTFKIVTFISKYTFFVLLFMCHDLLVILGLILKYDLIYLCYSFDISNKWQLYLNAVLLSLFNTLWLKHLMF